MKQTNKLEIIGVLSLSLLICSAFAVSSCVPEMMKDFPEQSRSSLELLISAPSFAMLTMIALNPIVCRFLSERFMIITGLLIFGVSGLVPVFVKSYVLIFTARIFMGIGIGLLNAKAVSMIGERFTGDLRSKLQGIRCSMETLGQSALMFVVGFLLPYGWNYTFLVYASAFVILIVYLICVPTRKASATEAGEKNAAENADQNTNPAEAYKLTSKDWLTIVKNFLLGLTLVTGQMVVSLRLTSYLVEYEIGTSVDGANILSVAVFCGFIGGLLFGKLFFALKHNLLPLALLLVGISLASIGLFRNLPIIAVAACTSNMFLTIGLSYMFNGLSDRVPLGALNTANSMVLVGCNLGSSITPAIFGAIAIFNPALPATYFVYAAAYILLAVIVFVSHKKAR